MFNDCVINDFFFFFFFSGRGRHTSFALFSWVRKGLKGTIINKNYYNFLFGKKTGIVIAKGDKNLEGDIEKVKPQVEMLFNYYKAVPYTPLTLATICSVVILVVAVSIKKKK